MRAMVCAAVLCVAGCERRLSEIDEARLNALERTHEPRTADRWWYCVAFDPWRAGAGSEKLTVFTTCMRDREQCARNNYSCFVAPFAWCPASDRSCTFTREFCEVSGPCTRTAP